MPSPSYHLAERERLRAVGLGLGLARVGFTTTDPFVPGKERLDRWLAAGHHAGMGYMAAHPRRAEPRALMPSARTLIVAALPCPSPEAPLSSSPDLTPPPRGVVASYAWGDDYHHVLRDKLVVLAKHIDDMAGRPTASRICVDAAPLLEREAAARAGVGFVAASNMLVIPTVGTSVLLGELLTELELPPDAPAAATCGDCHVCADACPTGALSPYVVDARRCIAYLTIEHRGVIPRELRPLIGSHVFGCDVCQQVCPHNTARHATATAIGARTADPAACMAATAVSDPLLSAWLTLTTGDYRRLVRGTALTRTSRHQLARNAAVALGNRGDPESAPVLTRALLENPRALVRQHVAWALGRLGGAQARAALEQALTKDADEEVRQECQQALDDSRAQ